MKENEFYAVCGKPILHSKSPQIFKQLFNSIDKPQFYTRISSDNAQEILSIATDCGFSGLNITSPLKADMYKLMDCCDEDCNYIEAVNTVKIQNEKVQGYNTDTIGVIETLKQNNIDLADKNCLIIGYGNAARAAAFGLKKQWKNVKIFVTGRIFEKVEKFADRFNCSKAGALEQDKTGAWEKDENIKFTLIISTIPRNAFFDINKYLSHCDYFMDASYPDSLMSNEAKKYNCNIISGERWLINQALASYEIFTGKKAKLDINQITENFNNSFKKIIFLTGFSGSGKSSVGKFIAEKLNYNFFDTDSLIQEKENLSINEIFLQKGEQYFRNIEKSLLEELCKLNNVIIACGGGTLCNSETIDIVKNKGYVIWLYALLENCLNRIDLKDKPMLNNIKNHDIESLFNARKKLYCMASDMIVSNNNESSPVIDNIYFELINVGF